MTCVVDTHPLVWFLEGNRRLSPTAREALADPSVRVVIPTIALVEIAFLYARKRISADVPGVLAHLASAGDCVVYPLDQAVVDRLPLTLDIHDAIIVATALVFRDSLGDVGHEGYGHHDEPSRTSDLVTSTAMAGFWSDCLGDGGPYLTQV